MNDHLESTAAMRDALSAAGNPWVTQSSRIAYENAWLKIREDEVIRPDGSPGIYGVVELPESVGVLAFDANDRVALVLQWRYVHARAGLEIPTGGIDQGESHDQAARRELREETGLEAEEIKLVGSIENSNGATTDIANMFTATGLSSGSKPLLADERTDLYWTPFDVAVQAVLSGVITESTSVACILSVLANRGMPTPLDD